MKKLLICVFTLGIILPLSSFAFNTDIGENLNLSTPISDDYYVAGGTTNLNTNVKGDLAIIGGKLFINGNVGQDLMTFGGEQFIKSDIGESARILGGKVDFKGTAKKDLLIGAGEVTINGKIDGETKISAGKILLDATTNNTELNAENITLAGIIKGNTIIRTEKINIETGAKILGDLYYESPTQNTGLEQIVSGKVTFKQHTFNKHQLAGIISGFTGARFFFLFIFGLILLFVGQKRIRPSLETVKKHARESLGYGFVTYAALPVATGICAITVIGIPFSFVLITTFITLIIFAKLLNVYFYTNFLIEKRGGHERLNNRKKIGILLGCCIISGIVSGIDMIFAFFALGAIIKTHIIKKK